MKNIAFLCFVAALGGVLFGYDTAVISGTIAAVGEQFRLDALAKGWYVGCALVGSIGGVAVAGWLSDRFGRKPAMLFSSVLFSVSALGCLWCVGFADLVAYRIIGGVGIGIVSIVSPVYISEISPQKVRGSMVALYQLAITAGFVLAYLVNYLLLVNVHVDELWRIMLGAEAVITLFFFAVIFFIPESPRWLAARGLAARPESAPYRSGACAAGDVYRACGCGGACAAGDVYRACGCGGACAAGDVYRACGCGGVCAAGDVYRACGCGRARTPAAPLRQGIPWSELRKPGIVKAMAIGCAIAILGQFMGVNAVLYYGPEIFANAGFAAQDSSFSTVLVGMVNMFSTILAVFLIDRIGRKGLIYIGVSIMVVCLVAIGIMFNLHVKGLAFVSVFLVYIFAQAISISAVVFVLLSEMYPNKVRGVAMSVAGFALWIGTYLIGQFTPWCMATLGSAGTFFFFAAMCFPYLAIMRFLVPETTGKSLEEIEAFWR